MRRNCVLALFLATGGMLSGCGQQAPTPKHSQRPKLTVAPDPEPNPPAHAPVHAAPSPPVEFFPQPDASQQKYDDLLLAAIDLLSQKKYALALDSLETAAKIKDTELVQTEIKKLRFRVAQHETAERAVLDIQTLIDQGKSAEASQFAGAAVLEFGATESAPALFKLKLQADALAADLVNDKAARQKAFRDQGQAALDGGNLRAAALAFEQVLQLGDDGQLRKQHGDIVAKLAKYDDCRQRAAELRKDTANLEDALQLLDEAAKQWDTLQIQQDIDDCKLALQFRRDRVAVADFEVRGEPDFPAADRVIAEELLPFLKGRFDIVERSQIARLLSELKIEAVRLGDSDQDQREIGRLAKVRFLVLGSLSPLSGLTINARLVDARTGLIVQTAKVSAPTPDELIAKLPELAKLLLMNDQEHIVYEQELAKQAPPIQQVQIDQPIPAAPDVPAADQPLPAPEVVGFNRPPDFGGVKVQDFQRFQPAPAGQPLPVIEFGGAPEDLWRRKAFYVSLSLGDSYFRGGRAREALHFFEFGLALGPAYADLDLRIARTKSLLPAPVVIVASPPPRIAIIDFTVFGDPNVVPPSLSWWAPQYLTPYFSPPYEVVDRGEVNWWMARMGMTVRDLTVDPFARRWLGRALNVRYFVFGTVTQTASFNIDTYLVDAEYGYLNGRGFVHARTPFELKWRLGELARMTQSPPALWQQQQQGYRDYETLVVMAQDSIKKNEFTVAIDLLGKAKKLRPGSLELEFYVQQTDSLAKQRAFDEQRRSEFERHKVVALERQQAQEKLAKQIEVQRTLAIKEALANDGEKRALFEKKRASEKIAAHNQLVLQARFAFKNDDLGLSIQLYEGALALQQNDNVQNELTVAKAKLDRVNKDRFTEAARLRDLKLKQKKEEELTKVRLALEAERKQKQQADAVLRAAQEERDNTEYLRLLVLGEKLLAGKKYQPAISTLQAAKQLKKTERLDALLNEAMLAQARADADAKGATARKEFERQLAETKAVHDKINIASTKPVDKTAEAEKLKKKQAFDQAVKEGKDLLTAKKYDDAIKAFQFAEALQPGDAAAGLLKQAQTARTDSLRLAGEAEKLKTKANYDKAFKQGQDLLAAKKYDDAIKAFKQADTLQPGDPAVANYLKKIELARNEVKSAQQKATEFNGLMKSGYSALGAKQYAEAVKNFTAAGRLMPNDPDAAKALRDAQIQWTASKNVPATGPGQPAEYAKLMQAGAAFDKQKRWDDAIKSFSDALKLQPKDAKATEALNKSTYNQHLDNGSRFMMARQFLNASREFEAALRLYPNDPEATAGLKRAKEAK